MAITIPSGCWRQKDESVGTDGEGARAFSYILKGGYGALDALQTALKVGDVVEEGWFAKTWTLQRGAGDSGTLTIECVNDAGQAEAEEGELGEDIPLKETWKIHAVRNDMNILAYCGQSESSPNRRQLELWMKETNGTLAENFQFRDEDGYEDTLSPVSQLLAAKIAKGVESVVRFYPVLVRQRIYAEPPPDCLAAVGFVDDPPTQSLTQNLKKPKNLATKIALFQWLKMQDDCDESADGKWTRTESWWGLLKTEGNNGEPWDADLYGANRWPVPLQGSASGGSS